MKRAIISLVIIAAIGAGAGGYYIRRAGADIAVNTSPLSRGEIIDTVGATGTLQAVTTVQVGSQVSGNIAYLGADFNSIVRKNQVIARLDPSLFEAQVQQARANLSRSRADLVKATSDVERNRVALTDAQQKFTRARELAARSLLPQSELDAAKIAVDSAQAQLQSAQAAVQSSQAQVEQAQASLSQNQVNLQHCVITAPIDGIVIQRSVDVGQTVAASLQSPTLFIIAADLTKMQVNANIDEADVGRIRPGQNVVFRVDAYPGDEFQGRVAQIRLQPVVVQNVTTYGTIVEVPNAELKLKPGMTANLKVQIARRADALRVPNGALRFRPSAEIFAALEQPVPPEAQFGGGRGGRGGNGAGGGTVTGEGRGGNATMAPPGAGAARAGQRPMSAPAPTAGQAPSPTDAAGRRGMGGDGLGRGGEDGDRRARMTDRFKSMSSDEQKQFLERMKARGMDTSGFEQTEAGARAPAGRAGRGPGAPAADQPTASSSLTMKYGAQPSAETIDALFAPLPPVESSGRVWLYVDKQLKAVRVRLGITDGTNTELLSNELQSGTEVVTGVTGVTATRGSTATGSGNPLMPQRGGPPRGGGR